MNEEVLVVDDDARVLNSILRALREENINCIGETDPRKAVELFRSNPTDVVIVDYQYDATPNFTGVDVISAIKEFKPFTRTILISGRIDHNTLDEGMLARDLQTRLQCDYYLPKSGDRDQLIEIVNEALEDIQSRSTVWKKIAEEYTEQEQVSPKDVRDLNEEIREHIIQAIEQERDE